VRRIGWIPTAGSTGVYLSIRARMPGVSRDAIDRAAIDGAALIEVPGAHARPPVLVPRSEMALALRLHLASYQKHAASYFASEGISEAAFAGVAAQVCRLLDEEPLASSDIRKSISHLDAGELLTGVLVDLAVRGVVRRFPVDGRLNSSKYMYELRHPDDRPDLAAVGDAAAVLAKAAELFLGRHGPATLEELSLWGDVTKGAARKALGTLGAEPVAVPGWAKEAWLPPGDMRAWRSFKGDGDDDENVVLLPFRDPCVHMRHSPAVLARDTRMPVLDGTLKRARISDVNRLHHHTILSGGDVIGVWEYDPKTENVLTRLWNADAALRRRVGEAADKTARFIREQLGDAKISAVDPPAKRAKRLAFCRMK
jgi:winged helix DNA-binding protein